MSTAEEGQGIVSGSVSGVDAELEHRVKQQAAAFQRAYRRTVEEAWKLGQELRRARDQVRHGQWIPWVEGVVGLTPRTAQRLMALCAAYPEMRQVSHLDSVNDALRALPSGSKSGSPPEQHAAPEADAASAAAPVSERDIAKPVQDLARVVERLRPVLAGAPGVSAQQRDLQLPVLCRALEVIIPTMIQYVNREASGGAADAAQQALITSLDAALAKAREFKDEIADSD